MTMQTTSEGGPQDVFVVPFWQRQALTAAQESVLFSIFDCLAQESFGIWCEQN